MLYNFFGSSPLKNQWRVVYEFMSEQNLLDAASPVSFPSFNELRHNIMCSELKQLYVAITRTRQRLWISENTKELSRPMFDYWKRKCLTQVRKLDDSLAQAMQVASSPEEWKARGIKVQLIKIYFSLLISTHVVFFRALVMLYVMFSVICCSQNDISLPYSGCTYTYDHYVFFSSFLNITMRWQPCALKELEMNYGKKGQRPLA